MHSSKELQLNDQILALLTVFPSNAYRLLVDDEEIRILQEYANTVSVKRLGYNDHGSIHMRKVTYNAVQMALLLQEASISLSLEADGVACFEDSLTALIIAAFLHDLGMSIGRSFHENTGLWLAQPMIDRLLARLYPESLSKRVILRSLIMECIMGHMANIPIHSLEAGILLVADGCDMDKGRARLPSSFPTDAQLGDIHKYSVLAIKEVVIAQGKRNPICIEVMMTGSAGFFQIEEVLFPKIKASPIKPYVELYATLEGEDHKCYL